MSERDDRQYAKEHEWAIFEEDGTCRVGISFYAQKELGNLVFANLPEVGDTVTAGTPFADVESIKTVSDVYSPVTGVVKEINEAMLDSPELINNDPYEAWFAVIEKVTDKCNLLSAGEYDAYIDSLS